MTRILIAFILAMVTSVAHAATFSQSTSFSGDLCRTDRTLSSSNDDFRDCNTIPGNVGIRGIYDFVLSDLDPNPIGDATVSLFSTAADLYQNGGNNSGERFRLWIDGVDYGLLFDRSTSDEAAINASLAQSVQDNINENSSTSAGLLDLNFTIALADFAPMVADGELVVRVDFRQDLNVNQFQDPTASVSYEVASVPLPASVLLLLGGLGGLGGLSAMRARKRA